GLTVFFNSMEPLRLFAKSAEHYNIDLSVLEHESNCSFNGVQRNNVYFSTSSRDTTMFFKVSFDDEPTRCEIINEV
ncbi:hypothetical protein PMAYCL1PPCAC_09317, partial [Pristionchus mayeri]